MTNSNNNQSPSLLSVAVGLAKKLSSTGLEALNHVAPGTVAKMDSPAHLGKTLEGEAQTADPLKVPQSESPQQMFRQHLPKISNQLLGRHYNRVHSVASFFAPDIDQKVSDYLFERLNEFVEQFSSVDKILQEAGVKNLTELKDHPDRSERLSQALIEQNKLIAITQGAVSGASGVVGAAIDLPFSIALALRTIYQTGRAHGFELNHAQEQEIVQFIFKEVDLSLVAEKQTLLMSIKAVENMLKTHDVSQFQQLLGSSNDADFLKNWLIDEQGQFKYGWLNQISKVSVISKLTPVASATLSAVYSWRLIEDAGQKSQAIFGAAQHYLVAHPDEKISPLNAYFSLEKYLNHEQSEKTQEQLNQPQELASKPEKPLENKVSKSEFEQEIRVKAPEAQGVSKVVVTTKKAQPQKTDEDQSKNIETKIASLAEQYVEPHDETKAQQPALSEKTAPDPLLNEDDDLDEIPTQDKVK